MSGAAAAAPTARAFCEALPIDTPVKEVVAQAKAAGLTIAPQTVHAYRHKRRTAAGKRVRGGKVSPQRLLLERLPDGWTTEDAIVAAKKAGLKITVRQIVKLRHQIKKHGKVGGGAAPPSSAPTRSSAKPKRAPKPMPMPERERKLHLFKQLILEIGMDAAQEIWDEFAYVRDGASARLA